MEATWKLVDSSIITYFVVSLHVPLSCKQLETFLTLKFFGKFIYIYNITKVVFMYIKIHLTIIIIYRFIQIRDNSIWRQRNISKF